ncbi:MAG: protein kinase, partial [Byssovorax sp.]
SLLGSPLYMSPEQLQSARRATVQSDIWSLGAILYQLLAGKVPFYTRTLTELIMMINLQPPPPMAALREGIPPGLEAAAFRCLEKKPEARFANVGELAWAIAEYGPPEARASAEKTVRTLEAAGVRVQRTTEASGAHRAPSAPAIAIAQPRSVPPHSAATLSGASTLVFAQTRTRKPLVMAGVAVSVALAATVVGLMMRSAPSPSEPSTASAVSVAAPAAAEIAPTPTVATAALASASAATEPTVVAPPPAPPPDVSAAAVAAARKPATGPGSPARPASPAPSAPAAPTTTAKSNPLDIKIKD